MQAELKAWLIARVGGLAWATVPRAPALASLVVRTEEGGISYEGEFDQRALRGPGSVGSELSIPRGVQILRRWLDKVCPHCVWRGYTSLLSVLAR